MLQTCGHSYVLRVSASCMFAIVLPVALWAPPVEAAHYAAHSRVTQPREQLQARGGAAHRRKGGATLSSCVAAYKESRENERTGHLRAARDFLIECAKPACGKALRQQCINRYTRLDADMPSVVPVVTDRSGTPRVDVEVKVDGTQLASRLDGRAIAVDPGVHEFSFHSGGELLASQKVMIIEGQRNRPIAVSVAATGKRPAPIAKSGPEGKPEGKPQGKGKAEGKGEPVPAIAATESAPERNATEQKSDQKADSGPQKGSAPTETAPVAGSAAPPIAVPAATDDSTTGSRNDEGSSSAPMISSGSTARRRPTLPYVLAAVGVAGIGGFGLATYWGRQDNAALSRCAPNCQQGSVDHVHNLYLAANISLGVGIAALGTAAVLWASSSHRDVEETASKTAYHLDIRPTKAGAFAAFSGAF